MMIMRIGIKDLDDDENDVEKLKLTSTQSPVLPPGPTALILVMMREMTKIKILRKMIMLIAIYI